MQHADEVGAASIAFAVLAVATEAILDLHHRALARGQYQRALRQREVDRVAVLLVIVAEPPLRRLVHARTGRIERQAVGDILGLCGWIARHRMQAQVQRAAIERGGQVTDHQAAVALDQRLDREAFDRVSGCSAQLDLQRSCQPIVDPGLPLRADRLQAQLGHGGGALDTACAGGWAGGGNQSPALAPVASVCSRARQQSQQQAGQGQARHRRFQ